MTDTRAHRMIDATTSKAAPVRGPTREIPSPLKDMVWRPDLMNWALDESRWREPDGLPRPFCIEVGRRLLLAQLEFSQWVLRRVEKVQFDRDRSVTREIGIDLSVHHEAPIFVDVDGREQYLIPLSIMRRRTLVNLDLRDEHGQAMSMLGIRLTQQLDESLLLAAAATDAIVRTEHWASICEFVRRVVAGPYNEVFRALAEFDQTSDNSDSTYLSLLRQNRLFCATLNRLRKNFTLYVLLDKKEGRQRLLQVRFNEPMEWSQQTPALEEQDNGSWTYQPGGKVPRRERSHILAALGLRPTRIRLQIPSAEYAASYHFEFTAPMGVRIVQAALLAGRPNDPDRHVSIDHIVGHSPIIGLHAVEIPNGSLCRAQLDLRIRARGWLTTVVAGVLAIAALQTAIAWEWWSRPTPWTPEAVTNVVVILVTVSAAVIALVAQQEFRGVAARMVTAVRAIGVGLTAFPIVTAILLVFSVLEKLPRFFPSVRDILLGMAIIAFILMCLNLAGWFGSWRDERRPVIIESPWDMTTEKEPRMTTKNFTCAIQDYEFDSPSIGIRSAEGWHETYDWCDARQYNAIMALSPTAFWSALSHTFESIERAATCEHHAEWAECEARAKIRSGSRPAAAGGAPSQHLA